MNPLCILGIWLVMVCFCLSVCFAIQDGIARLKRLHQVPCSHCAYFTGEYHLKCAVHPCRALSESAIGCADYELKTRPQSATIRVANGIEQMLNRLGRFPKFPRQYKSLKHFTKSGLTHLR